MSELLAESDFDFDDLDGWNPPRTGWGSKGSVPTPSTATGPRGAAAEEPAWAGWAVAAGVFSQLSSAYANFHATRMATYEAKSQASAMGHKAVMLSLDRRSAERRAESILEQGQSEIGNVTLAGGQRRAAIEASAAARGVEAGVGSAAEVMASEKLVEEIDVYNITLGAVQAANAARAQSVALGNEVRFARASSRNLRRSARAAAPETSLFTGIAEAAITGYEIDNYRKR